MVHLAAAVDNSFEQTWGRKEPNPDQMIFQDLIQPGLFYDPTKSSGQILLF